MPKPLNLESARGQAACARAIKLGSQLSGRLRVISEEPRSGSGAEGSLYLEGKETLKTQPGATSETPLARPPTKSLGDGPIYKPAFPNHVFLGNITPGSRIRAVHGVITHRQVMVGCHLVFAGLVFEERGEAPPTKPICHHSIDVPEVMVLLWSRGKGINILEVRGGSIEPLAIDDQVLIIPNAHPFDTQGHKSLDIELPLGKAANPLGFENEDLAPLRTAEVVAQAIDEQVIARDHSQTNDVLASAVGFVEADAIFQSLR